MFDELKTEDPEPEQQKAIDYSGVIIGAIALPLFFIFRHFGNLDMGLSAFVWLGMNLLGIRLRWGLRKCYWFWVTSVLVLALEVPLVILVPWPHMTVNRITLLPIGVAVLAINLGAVKFVETFVVKYVPPDDEE